MTINFYDAEPAYRLDNRTNDPPTGWEQGFLTIVEREGCWYYAWWSDTEVVEGDIFTFHQVRPSGRATCGRVYGRGRDHPGMYPAMPEGTKMLTLCISVSDGGIPAMTVFLVPEDWEEPKWPSIPRPEPQRDEDGNVLYGG